MQRTIKKELSFSLDTLERYRAKYGRSASLDTNGTTIHMDQQTTPSVAIQAPSKPPPPPSLFKPVSPPKMTKLQELQQKKEAYLRAREQEKEQTERIERIERIEKATQNGNDNSKVTSTTPTTVTTSSSSSSSPPSPSTAEKIAKNVAAAAAVVAGSGGGCYTNWSSSHSALATQPWVAISDLMFFCDKYEFKTLSTRDLKTHQEIVGEVRALLAGKAPFDQRARFPGNIHDPENLWVCIGRCASVEYHLQRIASVFRKPLNQLLPDKQRAVRQNFHLAVSELRLDISARISEVRLYDRLVFEREFRLEWQDE